MNKDRKTVFRDEYGLFYLLGNCCNVETVNQEFAK